MGTRPVAKVGQNSPNGMGVAYANVIMACFHLSRGWLFAAFALFASVAWANEVSAQTPDVRVDLTGNRVVVTDGKESFVKADKAGPGDVIQYEAVYKNTTKGPLKNI